MTFGEPKQHFIAAGAYLGIGDNSAVITEASATVATYEDSRVEDRAYDNIAAAGLHAAIAHVRAGELDAAGESAHGAFQIGVQYRSAHVAACARRLHQQFGATGLRHSPLAVETRDRIEDFLAATPTRPQLS